MNERNFFLDPRTGSNLLLKAAGEKVKFKEVSKNNYEKISFAAVLKY